MFGKVLGAGINGHDLKGGSWQLEESGEIWSEMVGETSQVLLETMEEWHRKGKSLWRRSQCRRDKRFSAQDA